ncbi:MAG: twin-arginine translocation signal domain-containing protein, partial [Chloroflexota bacterium]
MTNVTRRGFLRTASISAAATGVLTAIPAIAQTAEPGASAQGMPLPGGSMAPAAAPIGGGVAVGSPMVVYIA